MADVSLRQLDSQEKSDYQREWDNNKALLLDLLKTHLPDVNLIYEEMTALQFNSWILIKVMRALSSLVDEIGTQEYGQVLLDCHGGELLFIKSTKNDRLAEKISTKPIDPILEEKMKKPKFYEDFKNRTTI